MIKPTLYLIVSKSENQNILVDCLVDEENSITEAKKLASKYTFSEPCDIIPLSLSTITASNLVSNLLGMPLVRRLILGEKKNERKDS